MRKVIVFAAGVLAAFSGAAQTGDAAAGKMKAGACIACHGTTGVSVNPLWPNLAGQKQGYLMKQIAAFKEGARSDPIMSPMVKPLNGNDIANIAAYFSSLQR